MKSVLTPAEFSFISYLLFESMFLDIQSVTSSSQTFTEYIINANDYLIIRESKNNETLSLHSVQA